MRLRWAFPSFEKGSRKGYDYSNWACKTILLSESDDDEGVAGTAGVAEVAGVLVPDDDVAGVAPVAGVAGAGAGEGGIITEFESNVTAVWAKARSEERRVGKECRSRW